MNEEERTTPKVSREQVDQFKELQKIMKEFRKTLGPRKEAMFDTIIEAIDITEVLELVEVGGGESLTVSGEVEGQPISIMFRLKLDKE